jgi:hypothetical protein
MAPGEKYWYMVIIYGTNDYKFCCLLPVLKKEVLWINIVV